VAIARKLVREGKVSIKDAWKRYISNPTRPDSGKGTLSNYERYWKRFASWLERIHPEITQLAQVSQDIAQEYATELWNYVPPSPKIQRKQKAVASDEKDKQSNARNGLSPTTYNQQIGALRLIARVLAPEAGMDENPWLTINKKTAPQQCRKDFSREELQRLFDEFDKPETDIRDKEELRLLFHIGAFTGLRLEDATMLRWEAIDWPNRIISVMPVKTIRVQRRVRIPLHPALEDALSSLA
jgi:integrase